MEYENWEFENSEFENSEFENSEFEKSELENWEFENSEFENSEFENSKFENSHENGFLWHYLNNSAIVTFKVRVRRSLDLFFESGFWKKNDLYFKKNGIDITWILFA